MTRLTALESGGIGLIALGPPENIGRLLDHARQLGRERVMLLSPAGPFFVATLVDWELREVSQDA